MTYARYNAVMARSPGIEDHSSRPASPETALWRAVVLQAIEDAEAPPTTKDRRLDGDRAISWFGTLAFRRVCELADLNPEAVMRRVFGAPVRRKAA